MKNIIEKRTIKTLSRRDNMLVENEIFTISHRPVRDGMWRKRNSLLFDCCKAGSLLLTRHSEDATSSAGRCSSLRGTKQSRVSCCWIASFLAMTNNCVRNDGQSFNPVNPDSDRKKGKRRERAKVEKGEKDTSRNLSIVHCQLTKCKSCTDTKHFVCTSNLFIY
jgi:hypothetical protein